LHLGSLVAALGSFLQARSHGGEWYVRIEDLDPPREMPGAADDILRTLETLGLHWDGEVTYQSRRQDLYQTAFDRLRRCDLIYPCACTRREIADSSLSGIEGPVYPGTCRAGLAPGKPARAWRVRVTEAVVEFDDVFQGKQRSALAADVGDFVVKRADGLFAYQLAVVVDDAEQGMTEIVRGADLLGSTSRQIYLQRLLGVPTPGYAHLPVVVNARGEKLSKQTQAAPVIRDAASAALWQALMALGQAPEPGLRTAAPGELRDWALAHWSLARVPRQPVEFSGLAVAGAGKGPKYRTTAR
jgi:glutamyl-Q tRNA(Asp) synthetase